MTYTEKRKGKVSKRFQDQLKDQDQFLSIS